MNVIERVQAILLKPKETWPVIEAEATDTTAIYKKYLVFLAAIPAVATFVGMSLVGISMFGVSYRVPVLTGVVNMVVGFCLTLGMVYVLALIADALAPSFKGEKNFNNALKLVAYGSTAGLVGGIFSLLPALAVLGLLAALYSIYLIYTGIPVLMKSPPDKALGYTAVLIVCGIVAGLVVGAISAALTGGYGMSHMGMRGDAGNVNIQVPGTDVTIDTAKLEDMGRKVEEASKRMEAAQAQGDTAATGKAMGELMGAALGGKGGTPIAAEALQALLPPSLGGLERLATEARTDNALGLSFSSASAEYGTENNRLEVKVQDLGAVPALSIGMAAWASSTVNRETPDEVEKVYQKDGMSIREQYRKDDSQAEMAMMLANGVLVEVQGKGASMDAVRKAVDLLDLKGFAGLTRAK